MMLTKPTLTLRQLHQALQDRGLALSYNSLSQLLNTDDIAAQLRIEGAANARRILPEVADVLAAFLPCYQAAHGRLPQASAMLRNFLAQSSGERENGRTGELTTRSSGELESSGTAELRSGRQSPLSSLAPMPPVASADFYAEVARIQGRAQGLAMTDRVLTARQAAEIVGVSVALLRRTLPPYRRFGNSATGDRWRLSDLLDGASG